MDWLTVLSAIWGVLNIILFFKIWEACDNIKRIANKYAPERDKHTTPETREDIDNGLQNK